jgi:hypothetical protein
MEPSRPTAAPVAMEKAEDSLHHNVGRNVILPRRRRTASTYSIGRPRHDQRRTAQSTAIANRAPKAGVRTRLAGERAAAAAGNVPLCWTKIHCSARKPRRTPTHDNPLIKPRPLAHAAATNQAVDRRLEVRGAYSVAVVTPLRPERSASRLSGEPCDACNSDSTPLVLPVTH